MKPKILIFLATIWLFNNSINGQQTQPTPVLYSEKTLTEIKKLQQAALISDYAYKQTGYLSNNIGARLSGSLQAQQAVEFVAGEMRKLGLDVRLQKVMVPHWVRGEEKGELIEFVGMAKGTTQKVVLTARGASELCGKYGGGLFID